MIPFILLLCIILNPSFLKFCQARAPNIVFFMPDDMHFLDAWGERPPPASGSAFDLDSGLIPNMQRVRSNGTIFTSAYVAGPKCAPSRFNVMTGRYCSRAAYGATFSDSTTQDGVLRRPVTVPRCKLSDTDNSNNIQTYLSSIGYNTIHSGKWHLTAKSKWTKAYSEITTAVTDSGFTYAESVYHANMEDAADGWAYNFSHNMEWMVNTSLTRMQEASITDTPFYLYFAPTAPHQNANNEAALLNYSVRATPSGTLSAEPATTMPSRQSVIDRVDSHYDASASDSSVRDSRIGTVWCDDALGALIDGVEALGQLDNTIFVVTMDHGQSAKNTLFEGGTRVVLMVMGPTVQANATTNVSVSNIDLAPTFAQAATEVGTSSSSSALGFAVDGISWWSAVSSSSGTVAASEELAQRKCIISEIDTDRAMVCNHTASSGASADAETLKYI
mmetsp:Transcript_12786/g.25436  ORF Transcript_12786/g.25436 Transcript_12786/m.25436 type:complete len:446 (+) Transcript_12786:38-1375(+)